MRQNVNKLGVKLPHIYLFWDIKLKYGTSYLSLVYYLMFFPIFKFYLNIINYADSLLEYLKVLRVVIFHHLGTKMPIKRIKKSIFTKNWTEFLEKSSDFQIILAKYSIFIVPGSRSYNPGVLGLENLSKTRDFGIGIIPGFNTILYDNFHYRKDYFRETKNARA